MILWYLKVKHNQLIAYKEVKFWLQKSNTGVFNIQLLDKSICKLSEVRWYHYPGMNCRWKSLMESQHRSRYWCAAIGQNDIPVPMMTQIYIAIWWSINHFEVMWHQTQSNFTWNIPYIPIFWEYPCHPMITHSIDSYQIPSQSNINSKLHIIKNGKNSNFRILQILYTRQNIWICLIRCMIRNGPP